MRVAIAACAGGYSLKPLDFLGSDKFQVYRNCAAGARWDARRRINVVEDVGLLVTILGRFIEAGFVPVLDERAKAATQQRGEQLEEDLSSAEARMDAMDVQLQERGLSLYNFQRVGVRWLASRSSALLADEMGTGKSIQALAALRSAERLGVIIICPVVLKGNWKNEIARWRPDFRVSILSGKGSFRWPERGEVVIINYDVLPPAAMLAPFGSNFKEAKFAREEAAGIFSEDPTIERSRPIGYAVQLILDEAHFAKNTRAQRTIACRALASLVRYTYLLTATPLLNKPMELYSVLQLGNLAREAFGSFETFKRLFGGHERQVSSTRKALVWEGVTDAEEIGERLSRIMIRRLRSEVLRDLPTKTYRQIDVPLTTKYVKIADETVKKLAEAGIDFLRVKSIEELPFENFSTVRSALAQAKIDALEDLVEIYEEQSEPVVVFSAHQAPLDHLGKRKGWGVIHGGTSQEERTRLVDLFQAGGLLGLACGIKAAGVGITLTRAAFAIFVDRAWTPGDNLQAEDRICRIGQTRGCLITLLVADHALDKHLHALIATKMKLIAESVEKGRVIDKVVPRIDMTALLAVAEERAQAVAAAEERERVLSEGGREKSGVLLRPPRTPIETWARRGIETLYLAAGGAGALDSQGVGEALARRLHADEGLLSDVDWRVAVFLCKAHHERIPKFGEP